MRRQRAAENARCERRRNCLAWHTDTCPHDENCCATGEETMTDPEVHVDNQAGNVTKGIQAGIVHGDITFGDPEPPASDTEKEED